MLKIINFPRYSAKTPLVKPATDVEKLTAFYLEEDVKIDDNKKSMSVDYCPECDYQWFDCTCRPGWMS